MIDAEADGARLEFESLFSAYRDEIYRYCLRRVQSADALDAVADVFVTAWRRFDRMPDGDDARLWLYGVARNVVRNHDRSRRRRFRLGSKIAGLAHPDPPSPDAVVVRRSEEQAVVDALSRLSAADQELLRLKAWDELGNAEIATVLGIGTHAVDMRVHRALGRLARELERGDRKRLGSLRARGGER